MCGLIVQKTRTACAGSRTLKKIKNSAGSDPAQKKSNRKRDLGIKTSIISNLIFIV